MRCSAQRRQHNQGPGREIDGSCLLPSRSHIIAPFPISIAAQYLRPCPGAHDQRHLPLARSVTSRDLNHGLASRTSIELWHTTPTRDTTPPPVVMSFHPHI